MNQSSLGQISSFTFSELFAGIGGFRLALQKLGGICVFACEWDKFAARVYRTNFGEQPGGDITTIDPKSISDHDVLTAGFPCQPFSIAGVTKNNALGRPHGFEHPTQGTLFFNVAQIIASKRPSAFLLENVKNLVRHDGGRTFETIMSTLEDELSYYVFPHILDAKSVVPQHRERIYLVGFREPREFKLPVLPNLKPRIKDILEPNVADKYTLSNKLWKYLQNYAEKHRARGNGFGYGLAERDGIARTLSARYYKDGSEILVQEADNRNPRRLTPRECARLMGFPDEFKIVVSDTRAYQQFGNSVVVPVVEHIAREMIRSLSMKPSNNSPRWRAKQLSFHL